MPWGATSERNLNERSKDMSYQRWIGSNAWGKSTPIPQHEGGFAKGGDPMFMGGSLKTDPGCKAYEDRDFALKINERPVSKNMPLLSEFANYGDYETDAKRWVGMLYNRPVSLRIDYFVNNSEGRKASEIDVGEGDFLKNKTGSGSGKMGKQF